MRQHDFSSLRILIVDDDRFFLSILTHVLHGFGIREVTTTSTVRDAIAHCAVNEFDAAFVDCRMPPNHGVDFINYVRRDRECICPSLPIIMVSAYAKRDVVKSAIQSGANSFLVKPIRPRDVLKRLVALLEHPESLIRTASKFQWPDPLGSTDEADPSPKDLQNEHVTGSVTLLD